MFCSTKIGFYTNFTKPAPFFTLKQVEQSLQGIRSKTQNKKYNKLINFRSRHAKMPANRKFAQPNIKTALVETNPEKKKKKKIEQTIFPFFHAAIQ